MKNEKLMREGSITELLVKLSLPVILIMMVTVLYNMADVFFIGRSGDRFQLAAISLAGPVFSGRRPYVRNDLYLLRAALWL